MLEKERRKKEEEDRMKEKMQRMCTQRSILHKNCKASAQQLSKAELNPPLLLQSLATMEWKVANGLTNREYHLEANTRNHIGALQILGYHCCGAYRSTTNYIPWPAEQRSWTLAHK